jgi:hypothetical protein
MKKNQRARIFAVAITLTILMALTMNLVSAGSCAKMKLNPQQPEVGLNQEQHNVELNHSEPRAIPVERAYNELGYDDGWELSGHAWTCAGSGYAVRFTPPSYPIELLTARINFWPNWPNINHETFAIYVFAGDGRDRQPGMYLGGPVYHTATNWYWNDVDISGLHITIESGDFYILYLQLSGYPDCEALSFDRGQPYYGRSWDYSGGSWSTSQQAYNYMIRCVVDTHVGQEQDDIAVFRNGIWYVDTTGNHVADLVFGYGIPGDVPLVGNFGSDDIAIFRNGMWCVDTTGNHIADLVFGYGIAGDVPLVGDIDQDGTDDIAIFRNGMWCVDTTGNHVADLIFGYGIAGDVPLVGDINKDGTDDIAIFRNGLWCVDTTANHIADLIFGYGIAGDVPLVGDINKDGTDDIAIFRNGLWCVDTTGNHIADIVFGYGIAGDVPLVGDIG